MAKRKVEIITTITPGIATAGRKVVDFFKNLKTSITGTDREVKKLPVGFRMFRTAARGALGTVRLITRGLGKLRKTLFNVKTLFATVLAGFVARRVIGDFAKIEKKLAEIGTLLGAENIEELRGLGREIKKVAVEGAQSFEDEFQAAYDAISAGVPARKLLKFLRTANKLAVAGATDVGTATDLLTSSVNAFSASFDDAERFADALFTTVRLGKTTVDQLASSIGRVAPTAAAAGVSIEELGAAFAALTAAGLSSEESSTRINAALTVLVTLSDAQRKAAKRLGVDFSLTSLKAKGLVRFMQDLDASIQGNLEALAEFIPNVRAMGGLLVLSKNNAEKLTEAMVGMEGAVGAVNVAVELSSQTFSFRFQQFRSQIKLLTDDILTNLVPALGEAFTRAVDFLRIIERGTSLIGRAGRFAGSRDPVLVGAPPEAELARRDARVQVRALLSEIPNATFRVIIQAAKTLATIIFEAIVSGIRVGFEVVAPRIRDAIFGSEVLQIEDTIARINARGRALGVRRQDLFENYAERVDELADVLGQSEEFLIASRTEVFAEAKRRISAQIDAITDKLALGVRLLEEQEEKLAAASTSRDDRSIRILEEEKRRLGEIVERTTDLTAADNDLGASLEHLRGIYGEIEQITDRWVPQVTTSTGFAADVVDQQVVPATNRWRDAIVGVGTAYQRVIAFGKDVGRRLNEVTAFFQQNIAVRRATALGLDNEAAQLRIVNAQTAERKKLIEDLTEAGKIRTLQGVLMLVHLDKLHRLERDRLDIDQALAMATDELTAAEQRRSEALKRVEEQLRDGTITEVQAADARVAATAEFDQSLAAIEQRLISLRNRYPELLTAINKVIFGLRRMQEEQQAIDEPGFLDGVIEGLGDIDNLANEVGSTIGSAMGSAIDDIVERTFNLRDALRAIAQDLAKLFFRAAAISLITGKPISFEEGGPTPTGPSRGFPAQLHTNEFVEPAPAVGYYGPQLFEALRRRMVPRELTRMWRGGRGGRPVPTNVTGRFQDGGLAGRPSGGSDTVLPVLAVTSDTMDTLLAGGGGALLAFLGDHGIRPTQRGG